MIVIIDYNVGNLKSVENAFLRIWLETIVSRDHEVIRQADGIVLPGVGTFPVAMENLKKYDLIDILNERKNAGSNLFSPILTISNQFIISWISHIRMNKINIIFFFDIF